jgi:hypothetical protein
LQNDVSAQSWKRSPWNSLQATRMRGKAVEFVAGDPNALQKANAWQSRLLGGFVLALKRIRAFVSAPCHFLVFVFLLKCILAFIQRTKFGSNSLYVPLPPV